MGRAGGKDKLKGKSIKTRSQLRLFSDSELEKMVVAKEKPEEYSPGADHHRLLADAAELWMIAPEYILDPKKATGSWRSTLRTGHDEAKDSEEYWARALQALLYQARVDKPEATTVFRYQPFTDDHPLDRVRGWSSDVNVALRFAQLVVENDQEAKSAENFINQAFGTIEWLKMHAESGREPDLFANNGRITTSVYIIDNPEHGFSLNGEFLKEERDRQARDAFQKEKINGVYHKLNPETGKWEVLEEVEKLSHLKTKLSNFIVENIDHDRLIDEFKPKESDSFSIECAVEVQCSFEKMTDYLEEIGDQDALESWKRALVAGQKEFNQAKHVYLADGNDCYLNENEVIIDPDNIDNIRRVEVVLAESEEELMDLTDQKVVEKIKAATEKQIGNDPREFSPGQKTLFD